MSEEEKIEDQPTADIPKLTENENISEPLNINEKPSENMEVHHHPQVEKKNLKEYLLEGLMIFLAVTMGFFTENVREHVSDNHKEKEYMISMLSDLEKDTLSFDQAVATNKLLIMGTDSAMNYLGSDLNNRDTAHLALIYFYKYCVNFKIFRPPDGTIAQLKNNGGLRLITDTEVVNKINIYTGTTNVYNDWKLRSTIVTI